MSDGSAVLAARLAELWKSSRGTVLERVTVLKEAQWALQADLTETERRSAGREAAHKLSGVLGIFGLPRGSELASEMEHLLAAETPLDAAGLKVLDRDLVELERLISAKEIPAQE
jgi:HPt (histidine-containing phosphotransfer) domain-containing protein